MQRLVAQELEMTQIFWVSEEGEHIGLHAPFSPTSWYPMPQGSLVGNDSSWQLLAGPEDEKVVKSRAERGGEKRKRKAPQGLN